jgi:hypothetical protein
VDDAARHPVTEPAVNAVTRRHVPGGDVRTRLPLLPDGMPRTEADDARGDRQSRFDGPPGGESRRAAVLMTLLA